MNRAYGFQLQGRHQEQSVGLYAIGHEQQTNLSYRWDGNSRSERHCFVFQYTLKGAGAIQIADKTYHLKQNQAFWIEVPSDHCYYLPENSTHWEFIYLTLFGDTVKQLYDSLTEVHGHILNYAEQTPVIQMIYAILTQIEHNQLTNSFQASGLAYQFLMALSESLSDQSNIQQALPKSIEDVMTYINDNYYEDISLDDCVKKSNLSKYYFTRQFKKHIKMTPIEYLTTIRIQKAIELLLNDTKSIKEIAALVGYQNGNYFAKVFKKQTGKSPNAYRQERSSIPVNHWFIN